MVSSWVRVRRALHETFEKVDALRARLKPVVARVGNTPPEFARAVVDEAKKWVGVVETRRNRGPKVDELVRAGGGNPAGAHPWCARGLSGWFKLTAAALGVPSPVRSTGRAVEFWIFAGEDGLVRFLPDGRRVYPDGRLGPRGEYTPGPGDVFVETRRDAGPAATRAARKDRRRQGHTGLVTGFDAATDIFTTVEANTNDDGDREGEGVFARARRRDARNLVGFVRPIPWS